MKREIALLICITCLLLTWSAPPSRGAGAVMWLEISGNISPSTAEYVKTAIAQASGFHAVLITIDTFGGLGDSTFQIIDAMLNSSIPVIVYVYPPGRQSLSAGTYILMASSLAAMAPYTTIGSAQPVVNGVPTNESKIINFLVGKMKSMAKLHGRNETQAARFVMYNDNLGPEEALRYGVIEIVANDINDLMEKADGRVVKTIYGEYTLRTRGAQIVRVDPDVRVQLLNFLSDPLVSGLLITLGILILVVGLSTPGFGAEIVGAVLIVLGLVGQGFNINWAGLALIVLGSVLILYEFYSGGIMAAMIGGVILLTIGIILLIRAPPGIVYVASEWLSELQITVTLIAAFGGGITAFVLYKALRATRRTSYELVPVRGTGRAVEDIETGRLGYVVVAGEYRRAKALKPVRQNQTIKVVGSEGGVLLVEPQED